MFATAIIALIDTTDASITIANAGQTPPILWRAGAEPEYLKLAGLPLGARAQASYTQQRLPLAAGDLWILTTDGLLDQSDPSGYPNLLRRLAQSSRRTPRAVLETLFAVGAEVERDDRTAVLISRMAFVDAGSTS